MFQTMQVFSVNFTLSAVSDFSFHIVSSEVQKRLIQNMLNAPLFEHRVAVTPIFLLLC